MPQVQPHAARQAPRHRCRARLRPGPTIVLELRAERRLQLRDRTRRPRIRRVAEILILEIVERRPVTFVLAVVVELLSILCISLHKTHLYI